MCTIEATWRRGAAFLAETAKERCILVSQVLLAHVLKEDRSYLFTYPEKALSRATEDAYFALLARFQAGEPLEYICGGTEFYSLYFLINQHVLVPRPETEMLVEQAIAFLRQASYPTLSILDLGTGSGVIAISLAMRFQHASVTAIDVSEQALRVARENARRHGCDNRLTFLCSDWFSALPRTLFDCIVSNPPYLTVAEWRALKSLHGEPPRAFMGGIDGLEAFREIAESSKNYLKQGGMLLFEHGYAQAEQIRDILRQAGYCEVFSVRDFAQIERVTAAKYRPVIV